MLVIPTRVPGIRRAFGTVSPKACLTESVAVILVSPTIPITELELPRFGCCCRIGRDLFEGDVTNG